MFFGHSLVAKTKFRKTIFQEKNMQRSQLIWEGPLAPPHLPPWMTAAAAPAYSGGIVTMLPGRQFVCCIKHSVCICVQYQLGQGCTWVCAIPIGLWKRLQVKNTGDSSQTYLNIHKPMCTLLHNWYCKVQQNENLDQQISLDSKGMSITCNHALLTHCKL